MSRETESKLVTQDEGSSIRAYIDSLGYLTGGIGHKMSPQEARDYPEGTEIPKSVRDGWFASDMANAETDARTLVPEDAPEEVLDIVTNMAFNMGRSRLSGFRKMFAAIHSEDYETAADEMLDSKWAGQVKGRATRLADRMRNVQGG